MTYRSFCIDDIDGTTPMATFEPAYDGGLMLWDDGSVKAVDLSTLTTEHGSIMAGHDGRQVVGTLTKFGNDGKRLNLYGPLNVDSPARDQVYTDYHNKEHFEASIRTYDQEVDGVNVYDVPAGTSFELNGRTLMHPDKVVRVFKNANLREVSFVRKGAGSNTKVHISASALTGDKKMNFIQWLTDKKIAKEELTDEKLAELQLEYDFEVWAAEKQFDLSKLDEENKTALKLAYETEIAQRQPETAPAAETASVEAKKETTAATPAQPAVSKPFRLPTSHLGTRGVVAASATGTVNRPDRDNVLATAILLNTGSDPASLQKHCRIDSRTIDEAMSGVNRTLGIRRLAETMGEGMNFENIVSKYRANVNASATTGFSTVIGVLLKAAQIKTIEMFKSINSVARMLSRVVTVTGAVGDPFIPRTIDLSGKLQKRAAGGEIKHLKTLVSNYQGTVEEYSGMITIDEHMFNADDTVAFMRIPADFAFVASQTLDEVWWDVFAKHADRLFVAGNNRINLPLNNAGLTAGVAAFGKMKDPAGVLIGMQPRYMVVPTELEPMARALHTLQTVPGDTVAGTNTFIGKYEPVSSPYMSELPLTPFNWMLLGDPNQRPLMAIGYYKGIENPIIETREADFNTYGVSTRCKLVFGVCPVDGNSAVFSSGDAA